MSLELLRSAARRAGVDLGDVPESLTDQQLALIAEVLLAEHTNGWRESAHASATRHHKDEFEGEVTTFASELIGQLEPAQALRDGVNAGAVRAAKRDLDVDALHLLEQPMSKADCDEIIAALGGVDFVSKATNTIVSGYSPVSLRAGSGATHWVRDHTDVLRIGAVQRLIADPFVLGVVDAYLGARAVHVQTNCWWTVKTPRLLTLPSLDAHKFHQDREYLRFVKLFVYLTDVDEDTGPHRFVVGSHRDYRDAAPAHYSVTDRVEDSRIHDIYDARRIRHITGAAGTMFLADTSAFHAGMAVRRDHRLLLQLEYANSPYFGVTQPVAASVVTEPTLRAAIDTGDRLTVNYDDERYQAWKTARPVPAAIPRVEQLYRLLRARAGDLRRGALRSSRA